MPRTPLEDDVATIREDLRRTSMTLAQLQIPATAPLFGKEVTDAIHHVGVATLKLSNALVIGLPRPRA